MQTDSASCMSTLVKHYSAKQFLSFLLPITISLSPCNKYILSPGADMHWPGEDCGLWVGFGVILKGSECRRRYALLLHLSYPNKHKYRPKTQIHTCMHVHSHTHTHMHTHTCMHACMHPPPPPHTNTHMPIHTHKCNTHAHKCTHTHTHPYICMHTHKRAHTHTHTQFQWAGICFSAGTCSQVSLLNSTCPALNTFPISWNHFSMLNSGKKNSISRFAVASESAQHKKQITFFF